MEKINAVITGIGGYVPDYVLNNEELSRMVDTNDEWIMTRVGIKERRILTDEGLGTSYMARKAAKQLLAKTGVDPDTIDAQAVERIVSEDYAAAGIRPEQIRLGAVIITGETARKQNARAVAQALSRLGVQKVHTHYGNRWRVVEV